MGLSLGHGVNLGFLVGALALGATLGLLPGPVQFVLLTEASRGGMRRGFSAMLGANGTFGVLLLAFAAGVAVLAPDQTPLRVLRLVGGLFLLLLAADAFRSTRTERKTGSLSIAGISSPARGILAVLLNPGAWIFLATTASSLFAGAARSGGRPFAIATSVAMLAGIAGVDAPMVLLGGSVLRLERTIARRLTPVLATGLGGFGILLVVQAIRG